MKTHVHAHSRSLTNRAAWASMMDSKLHTELHTLQPDMTKKYARHRIEDPSHFDKLRTKDIGRKGHTKIILGRVKGTNTWKPQSVLVTREDYAKGERVTLQHGRPKIINIRR